jgi:hypothetical protein
MKAHLTRYDCEGFYKCCISNAMNDSDDMSCSNPEEPRNVTDNCEEDEDTECEDRHPKNSEAGDTGIYRYTESNMSYASNV